MAQIYKKICSLEDDLKDVKIYLKSLASKYLVAVVIILTTVIQTFSVALQAPFYPLVAEGKKASSSLYGIVFGVFSFVTLVSCPVYGKTIPFIGAKKVAYTGLFLTGVCNIAFGFVDKINDTTIFIALSVAIRIVEAVGYAGFRTASISIISFEFGDEVEIGFGFIQASFGFGVIMGPAIGGFLYEIGGFILPFAVVGGSLLFLAFVIFLLSLRRDKDFIWEESENGFRQLLNNPTTLLSMFSLFVAYLCISFLETVLEPHIRQLNLTPKWVGIMFACMALSLSVSSVIWGKLCSKYESPNFICSLGASICILALLLVGPAPYFPFHLSTGIAVVALFFSGIGEGALTVGGFVGINKGATLTGFSQNMQTHSLVSTLYMCSVTSGFSIGPILGGFLNDLIGFRWASQFFCTLFLLIILLTLVKKVKCDSN